MSGEGTNAITPARRKRINRLKKVIVSTVPFLILIPIVSCIVLGITVCNMKNSIDRMSVQINGLEHSVQQYKDSVDRAEALLRINGGLQRESGAENQFDATEDTGEAFADHAEGTDSGALREVYLTFDDGPSIYTEELLDILAENDVKATFFVTGKDKENYGDTYRRIVEEGHTLGMHSYSHEYDTIYASLGNFQQDLEKLRDFLYEETGEVSNFYRFPGGSSNAVSQTNMQDMIDYLDAMGISYFDWNVSAGDASSIKVSSAQIVDRVMEQLPSHGEAVVLMHDAADKYSTVQAVPGLIEKIRELDDGTVFLPITEETIPVQHVKSDNKEE